MSHAFSHPPDFYRDTATEITRELVDRSNGSGKHPSAARKVNRSVKLSGIDAKQTTLGDIEAAYRRWLGPEYDLGAIHAVIATAAAEQLGGDPLWLLLVSGSGNAKTETVQALAGAGAIVTSTITSEGALLSGTPKRDAAKDATGGLLRRLGSHGVLVIKDFTSILSMHRDTRTSLLAALREIHDQRWERNLGADGGRTLTWQGKIAILGAVTTVWDRAHDVIAAMGDRFVILRMDSNIGRESAQRHAMQNTGHEDEMRAELASVVGGVLVHIDPTQAITVTETETDAIGAAANIVTLCRTGVDFDYRGDVIDAHQPEMPTRFAKQLVQLMRGAVAVGMDRGRAFQLAIRCARDSMPPLRLAILDDVAANPHTRTVDVRRRLNKPRNTVDRQLQALHILGVLDCEELEGVGRQGGSVWYYDVAQNIRPNAISVPDLSLHDIGNLEERDTPPPDISGTLPC